MASGNPPEANSFLISLIIGGSWKETSTEKPPVKSIPGFKPLKVREARDVSRRITEIVRATYLFERKLNSLTIIPVKSLVC